MFWKLCKTFLENFHKFFKSFLQSDSILICRFWNFFGEYSILFCRKSKNGRLEWNSHFFINCRPGRSGIGQVRPSTVREIFCHQFQSRTVPLQGAKIENSILICRFHSNMPIGKKEWNRHIRMEFSILKAFSPVKYYFFGTVGF